MMRPDRAAPDTRIIVPPWFDCYSFYRPYIHISRRTGLGVYIPQITSTDGPVVAVLTPGGTVVALNDRSVFHTYNQALGTWNRVMSTLIDNKIFERVDKMSTYACSCVKCMEQYATVLSLDWDNARSMHLSRICCCVTAGCGTVVPYGDVSRVIDVFDFAHATYNVTNAARRRDGRDPRPHDRHPGRARAGQASSSHTTFARPAGSITRQRAQGRPTSQAPDNRHGGREITTTPINSAPHGRDERSVS